MRFCARGGHSVLETEFVGSRFKFLSLSYGVSESKVSHLAHSPQYLSQNIAVNMSSTETIYTYTTMHQVLSQVILVARDSNI